MAGADGTDKFQKVDREDEIVDPHFRGVLTFTRTPISQIAIPVITALQFARDLLFDATTPNALTGPTAQELLDVIIKRDGFVRELQSRYEFIIQNTDAVNPKVITLGPNYNPTTLTIPPSSYQYIGYELTQLVPPIFTLVKQLPGGAAGATGVTSFEGRTGAVVSAPGDYTAAEITNVPTGNIPATATNVQLALDYLQVYAPPPTGRADIPAPQLIAAVPGWVDVFTTFNPALSRSTIPGGVAATFAQGAAPGGGVADIMNFPSGFVPAPVDNLIVVTALVGVAAAFGDFGVRIIRNNTPGQAFVQEIVPVDLIAAGQNYSVTVQIRDVIGDTYSIQVNNYSATPVNVTAATLTMTNLGPTP